MRDLAGEIIITIAVIITGRPIGTITGRLIRTIPEPLVEGKFPHAPDDIIIWCCLLFRNIRANTLEVRRGYEILIIPVVPHQKSGIHDPFQGGTDNLHCQHS